MEDVKQLEGNWPPAQKESPQPKYKTLSFEGELQDYYEHWHTYMFTGNYYEFDGEIRFVEAYIRGNLRRFPRDELQNILRIDIREELNSDYTIIFETQIELK